MSGTSVMITEPTASYATTRKEGPHPLYVELALYIKLALNTIPERDIGMRIVPLPLLSKVPQNQNEWASTCVWYICLYMTFIGKALWDWENIFD